MRYNDFADTGPQGAAQAGEPEAISDPCSDCTNCDSCRTGFDTAQPHAVPDRDSARMDAIGMFASR